MYTKEEPSFGYDYVPKEKVDGYFFGNYSYKINDDNQLMITEVRQDFIGLKTGDILLDIEGVRITQKNMDEVWNQYFQNNTSPDRVKVNLMRDGRVIVRSGKPVSGYFFRKHAFYKDSGLSVEASGFHNSWLSGKPTQ